MFILTLTASDLLSINVLLSDFLVWVALNNLCALGRTPSCSVCKLFTHKNKLLIDYIIITKYEKFNEIININSLI